MQHCKESVSLTFSPTLYFGPDFGVTGSVPALMLLDVSDSPLLGVGDGSLFTPPSCFLEARGLEVVLLEILGDTGGLCFTGDVWSSPSDFRRFGSETISSVESSLLLDLALEETGWEGERRGKVMN